MRSWRLVVGYAGLVLVGVVGWFAIPVVSEVTDTTVVEGGGSGADGGGQQGSGSEGGSGVGGCG